MLAQLEDELARSRKREAFWISVVFHLALVMAIATSPRWMPEFKPLRLLRPETNRKDATFLALPNDRQKPPVKVETDKLSDKNRRAETRAPEARHPDESQTRGNRQAPGMPMPTPPQMASQPAMPAQPPARQQPQASQQASQQQQATVTPPPPKENPFKAQGSAGDVIARAARQAVPRAGAGGIGWGEGTSDRRQHQGSLEILSDTMGVDFGPYLKRIHPIVQWNMYRTAPESAMPPLNKRGTVLIEFIILPTGNVTGINILSSSGDVSLDRAAFATLVASSPLPPLPAEFHGKYLQMRAMFIYNALEQ